MIKQTKYVPIDVGHTDLMGGGGALCPGPPHKKGSLKQERPLTVCDTSLLD